MISIDLHIEALIFSSPSPLTSLEILETINVFFGTDFDIRTIEEAIDNLKLKYEDESFGICLDFLGGGWQFFTKPSFAELLNFHLKLQSKKRLSGAALETLAIIAYKQPLTKADIESVRGVNCDYAVQKLLEKDLIKIKGRADVPGKPLLLETSDKFMEYFGLNDIADLPKKKEILIEDQPFSQNDHEI